LMTHTNNCFPQFTPDLKRRELPRNELASLAGKAAATILHHDRPEGDAAQSVLQEAGGVIDLTLDAQVGPASPLRTGGSVMADIILVDDEEHV